VNTAAFRPDHRSPYGGVPAWDAPDPARQPVATIAAGLSLQLLEQRPDGWARVLCDNGWAGWVDGRRLERTAAGAGDGAVAPVPTIGGTAAPALSPAALSAPVRIGGVRLTTQLIGGALIVVGSFLPWVSAAGGLATENGFGVPLKVLFDPKTQSPSGAKIGFLTIVLGALTIAAGLKRLPLVVGRVAGGVALVVATAFLAQLQRAMGQAQVATVFGVLGMGVYLTALGGLMAAMSKGSQPT
jgi:hypothetical protein